jgi:hypothetical protein
MSAANGWKSIHHGREKKKRKGDDKRAKEKGQNE